MVCVNSCWTSCLCLILLISSWMSMSCWYVFWTCFFDFLTCCFLTARFFDDNILLWVDSLG